MPGMGKKSTRYTRREGEKVPQTHVLWQQCISYNVKPGNFTRTLQYLSLSYLLCFGQEIEFKTYFAVLGKNYKHYLNPQVWPSSMVGAADWRSTLESERDSNTVK